MSGPGPKVASHHPFLGLSSPSRRTSTPARRMTEQQEALRISALEIASSVVVGSFDGHPKSHSPYALDPAAALERAVLPALERPPCLVSFSGGHDSSLVLAAAVRVARREHLPLPVPITWLPTDAPRAEESAWQELVVDALELVEWIRMPTGDDLDFVGPVSTAVLQRHGVLYPANAFFHAPLIRQAAGGSLLTGFGGDQVLGRLRRPRRPAWWPRPTPPTAPFPWLRPDVARSVDRSLRREARARPVSYAARPAWAASRRELELTRGSLALLGCDVATEVVHPLLDPAFLAAICSTGVSPETAGGRSRFITHVFGRAYPEAVLRARPKATFGQVYWRRHTRSLLAAWDGQGIDPSLVDPAELRREWDGPDPDRCTALLAQQIWLASHGDPIREVGQEEPCPHPLNR
jgi:hypothetical protein